MVREHWMKPQSELDGSLLNLGSKNVVKGIPLVRHARKAAEIFCSLLFILASVAGIHAQEQQSAQPAAAEPESDTVQRRITRARTLAAVGRLAAAASDLEALRTSSADESVRDVARVLLMWIYVEMPDYARASALLDETFKAHDAEHQTADRTYFALAGQTINSVRTHLERYRTFGIDISDNNLPTEAAGDLDQLRRLLEKVMEQARAVRDGELQKDAKAQSMDATALLEDAATVRLRLAHGDQEQSNWQREVADARQRLVASETRIASVSGLPPVGAPPAAAANITTGGKDTANPPTVRTSATISDDKSANQKSEVKSSSTSRERAASSNKSKKATSPSTAEASSQGEPSPSAETSEAASKKSGAPVSVGPLTALATQKVSPSYPSIAKAARVSGIVTVYMVVNEKGTVESVQRADGPVQLQAAATDAARRWKFRPTVVDGQPARIAGFISFNFAL